MAERGDESLRNFSPVVVVVVVPRARSQHASQPPPISPKLPFCVCEDAYPTHFWPREKGQSVGLCSKDGDDDDGREEPAKDDDWRLDNAKRR